VPWARQDPVAVPACVQLVHAFVWSLLLGLVQVSHWLLWLLSGIGVFAIPLTILLLLGTGHLCFRRGRCCPLLGCLFQFHLTTFFPVGMGGCIPEFDLFKKVTADLLSWLQCHFFCVFQFCTAHGTAGCGASRQQAEPNVCDLVLH